MPKLRSDKVTQGKTAAAARSLWQAAGVKPSDFGKPVIAVGVAEDAIDSPVETLRKEEYAPVIEALGMDDRAADQVAG